MLRNIIFWYNFTEDEDIPNLVEPKETKKEVVDKKQAVRIKNFVMSVILQSFSNLLSDFNSSILI